MSQNGKALKHVPEMQMKWDALKLTRWVLSGVCLLVSIIGALLAWSYAASGGGADELPFTEPLQKAFDMRIEWSGKNADIALLLIAALWGLVLAGKDEIRLTKADRAEWLMFASANFLLGGTFFVHQSFSNTVSSALAVAVRLVPQEPEKPAMVPDILGPMFQWGYSLELWLLALGVVAGVITFLSSVYLKK